MKTVEHGNENIMCYQDVDFQDENFVETCKEARRLWDRRADEYVAENGRMGTFVIGAGFTVWYVPPRGRKPRRKMILRSPKKYQTSSTWESSRGEVAQVFADNGIVVEYEWGAMD